MQGDPWQARASVPLWKQQYDEMHPEEDILPPLGEDLEVDVLVIGAGFTGLSAARHLKEALPGLRIAVVEALYCGFGTSGRNTGYCNALVGDNYMDTLQAAVGSQTKAGGCVRYGRAAVRHVKKLIASYDIECDADSSGIVFGATNSTQEKKAKAMYREAKRLIGSNDAGDKPQDENDNVEYWDQKQCLEKLGTDKIIAAYYDPLGLTFNPYKLARGILHKALLAALRIAVYENSPVETLAFVDPKKFKSKVVATVRGKAGRLFRIVASSIVFGTNAYSHLLTGNVPSSAQLASSFAPLHVYSIASQPLPPHLLKKICPTANSSDELGIKRFPWYSLHSLLYAVRVTADGRLVCATGPDVSYYHRNELHVADRPDAYERLKQALLHYYPQCKDVLRVTHKWEGVIAVTLHDFPVVGQDKLHPNVIFSMAYCGHGVAPANYAGVLVRDMFIKQGISMWQSLQPSPFRSKVATSMRSTEQLHFVGTRLFPPVPDVHVLRKLIAMLYLGVLRFADVFGCFGSARPLENLRLYKKETKQLIILLLVLVLLVASCVWLLV